MKQAELITEVDTLVQELLAAGRPVTKAWVQHGSWCGISGLTPVKE